MSNVKRGLGRGLADLIPVGGDVSVDVPANPSADTEGTAEKTAIAVSIAEIHPNPNQPRTYFDEVALAELAESVRSNGVLQPILVRPHPTGGYEIVAGERRFRAALRVGLTTVPVVIRSLSDADAIALALIENLIRADIGPLETARAFRRLMDDFGWTQEEMGRRVGKSRPAVANALRLLSLPEAIQQSVERGEITEGHARALLQGGSESNPGFRERQLQVWRRIVVEKLSVRDVERLMESQKVTAHNTTVKKGAAGFLPPGISPAHAPGSVSHSEASGNHNHAVQSANESGDVDFLFRTAEKSAREAVNSETDVSPAKRVLSSLVYSTEAVEERAVEDRFRSVLGTRVRLIGTVERGRIEIEFSSPEELDRLIERIEMSRNIIR